jgi:hypothetical protein
VVAANGLVSVGSGLEVVPVRAAGPLAEPVGVVVAALAIAVRSARSTARSTLLPLETALLAAVALILVPGAVALASGGAGTGLVTIGRSATSVFTLTDVVLAALAGLVVLLLVRARVAGAGRPRWPWEDDEEP